MRAAGGRMVWFPTRQDYSSETKPFFLTSEFLVFVLYLMGLGIAAATIGYMLSRGIAKAASRSRARDPREDLDVVQD